MREADLTAAELRSADEVFLSSTLRDVWQVARLDGRDLTPGTTVPRLAAAFEAWSDELLRARYAPQWAATVRTSR